MQTTSSEVAPTGSVVGVDMTPEMIAKARANIAKTDLTNVEFRLGEIDTCRSRTRAST